MHRRKNNPSTVTKKPCVSASGVIMATAISVAAVMTAAVIAGINAVAVEGGGVAMIAGRAGMATAVNRGTAMVMAMVTDAITGRAIFPSRQKACASPSLRRRRRCTSW